MKMKILIINIFIIIYSTIKLFYESKTFNIFFVLLLIYLLKYFINLQIKLHLLTKANNFKHRLRI
jgi:hypothetical protein